MTNNNSSYHEMRKGWSGGIAEWVDGNVAYISVAFTWLLPRAYQRAVWFREEGYKVRAGGPAFFTLPKYLNDVAEMGGDVEALVHHNPNATIASRGCPVGCYFCIVPKMEGKEFTLIPDFVPRPILCDNNLSALPVDYQNHIIEKYQMYNIPLLDANSGFEPMTFDKGTYIRWKVILKGYWRFAFDTLLEENNVRRTFEILRNEPSYKKRVYVLIGNEPFESCMERIYKVIEWGGEPYCQPYMPLNALRRRPKISYDWTESKLNNVARWANRFVWRNYRFEEYDPRGNPKKRINNVHKSQQLFWA